jgi:hypothetical protein
VSAFDVLERQLRDSARRRRRSWSRRLVPAVVALAVVAVLLVLLPPHPETPSPSDERVATPSPAATTAPQDDRRLPPASHRPVPSDQLAAFAILRRPPSLADRSAAVRELLSRVPANEVRGVHMDAVRVLGRRGALLTILVPMERTPLPHKPNGLCVVSKLTDGSGMTCGTLADLRTHGYIGWPGPPFGLVPDGVASVKLRVRGGRTITAPVHDNVFSVDEDVFAIQPPVWLDVNGRRISRR